MSQAPLPRLSVRRGLASADVLQEGVPDHLRPALARWTRYWLGGEPEFGADYEADEIMRRELIERGIYFFPLATKQGSISAAHTAADIAVTLETWDAVLALPAVQEALGATAVTPAKGGA